MGWEFYFLNYEYIDEFPEDSCRLETEQLGFDILRRQELRKNVDLTCVVSRTGFAFNGHRLYSSVCCRYLQR